MSDLASNEASVVDQLRKMGAQLRFRKSGLIHTVNLSGNGDVGNELLADLAQLTRLAVLNLASTAISDEGLRHLLSLNHLENLDLQATAIGDQALESLSQMTGLKILILTGTQVSGDGLKQLRKSMLNTRIVFL